MKVYYTLPGGTLVDPGGDDAASATPIGPMSVSMPRPGTAWFKLSTTDLDVPWAWIGLSSVLSYLPDGTDPLTGPSVTLTVYDDEMTFQGSIFEGTDADGNTVPRGAFPGFQAFAGVDYYIVLTTADVEAELILLVTDYGTHTPWEQPTDQLWTTSEPTALQGSDPSGTPSVVGDVQIPFLRTDVGAPFGYNVNLRTVDIGAGFAGSDTIQRVFNGVIPGADPAAADCAWQHARVGNYVGQSWSSDGTGTGDGSSPTCMPRDTSGINAGHAWSDSPVGWSYSSSAVDASGHQVISFTAYATELRASLTRTLARFGATAGLDPATFTAPAGYTETNPIWEDDINAVPDLLLLEISPNHLSNSGSGTPVTWAANPVTANNANGEWNGWGPKEIPPLTTATSWTGDPTDRPEGFLSRQAVTFDGGSDWTPMSTGFVDEVLAAEAAAASVSGSTSYYLGGIRFVAMSPTLLDDGAPASGMTAAAGISNYQFVTLRLTLRPSRVRYADLPAMPAVDSHILAPVRLLPRDDEDGILSAPRMWPPAKSGARLFGNIP